MKEDLNEWKNILSLWMRRFDIFKDINFPQQSFLCNLTH